MNRDPIVRFAIEQLRLSEASPRQRFIALRKLHRRGVEASIPKPNSRTRQKRPRWHQPLPGTVGLRALLRYAPFLEEWSTRHADARRDCDRLL